MASGGTDDNAHLYRNVQELKYRLELTETSLNSLDALDGDKKGQGNMDEGPALTMADLSTEDRTTRQVESLANAASHRKLASQSSSETSNNVDDPCRGLIENTAISSLKTTSSSSSLSVSTCYDTEGLRMKLQELRDRNTDLVCQNNRLHNEVEAVCAKLQESNNQLAVTRKKTDEYKYAVPQLEDKLINVHAENESLEKALRDTEERLENSQRQLGEMDSCLRMHKRNTKCFETQLADTLRDKKKLEKDLETAVHSAEELRCSYEELRRKTKEKLKSYKTGHEDLVGKLEEAKQEKVHFLDNIATLQTKTSRLKGELSNHKMDSYCQAEAEKESTRLRADAVRLKKKIAELQASLTDTELMRNENCQLRNIVEDQQQRLDVCHTQLSCSKKQLCQMEQAVAVARAGAQSPHDSGFGYSGQMSTIDRSNLDGSYLDTLTAAGRKSPPQDAARVSELKMRLAQQECEIEQLRKQLACEPCSPVPCMPYLPCQCQCGDSGNSIIDCWRRELMSVLAKNREGERKMVELEEMVRRFESERITHTTEILSLGKRLEEFVLANSSLENKLTQRTVLINKLEQEVDEKENSIAVNERELRKRSLQITSIERLLDQKANEVSQQVALVSELEEAVQRKVVEAQKVRQELQERVNETKVLSEQLETVKQTSKEQQRALESHIEKMSQQLETKSNRVAEYEHKVEQLSQDLSTKEASLIQTKQQLQDHMEQSQNQIRSLETRVDDATKTVKQLESAMVVCKEEIGLYMDQISDMKERHESEINEKVDAMTNMQLDRAQLEQTLNERDEQLVHMETTLEQRQKMLVESNRHINDIEEEQARTQRQVEELEHVVMENEKLYKEDLQDAENRVNAISHDLEQTNNAMQIATVTNRELELEKKRLNAQVEDITEELKVEQKEKAEYVTKTEQLESDLSTTKQSLEEKKEQVTDMRREISEKVQQLDEKTKQIKTVTQQLHKTEEQLEILSVAGAEMQQELTAREEEIEQKARLIGEMKEEMREKMEDLKTKSREIDNLTISLNNRQTELQQRAAQVLQLEMDFVEYKTETEQRIAEMESTIFRSNCENERKDMQISELEACRRKHQDDLEACRAQYIHLEHIGCEQLSSLECQAVRIARLEQLLDEEKRRAIETLKENTCCDTELKNLKEHHQKMMLVLSESRQDLTTCQQENDRLANELEQAAVVAQAKQAECSHLLECMEVLKSQEAQRDSQMGADIRQLRQQMAAQEDHYKKEVAEFKACMVDKDNLAVDLQAKLKLLTEEHDAIKSRLPLLEEQYNGLRKDSHDALIGKEAEIARLEARISGYERATFGHAHTPVSTSTQQSHGMAPHPPHPHPTPPCQIPECPVPVQLTQPVQHCSPEHPHLVYDAHPTVCSQSDIDIHNVATSNNQQHTLRRSTSELSRLYQSSQSLASAGGGTSITNFSRLVTESELSFSLSTPSPSPTHQHLRIKKSLSDTRLDDELHRRSLPLAPQAMLQPSNRCNHATTPDIQDRRDYSASPASLNTSDPNCLQNMLSEINHQYGIHSTETSAGTISPATSQNRPMSSSPGTHLTTKLTLQLSPRMGSVPSQLSSPISSCLSQMSPRPGILSQFSSPMSPIAASSPVPRSPTLSTVTYDSLLSDGPSLGRLKPKSSTHSAQSKLSSRHMSASPDRLKPALKKKSSIKSGNSGRGEELLKSGIQVGSRTQRQPSGGKLRVQPKRDHSHEGDSFTSPHVTTAVSYYTGHDQHVMADTSVDTYGSHSGSPSCTLAPTVGTVSRDHNLSVTMPVSPVSGGTLDSTGMDSLMGVDSTDQEWSPEQCLSRLAERRAALQQRQHQLHRHLHEIEDTILASDPPNTLH